jgi:hypothetical protein
VSTHPAAATLAARRSAARRWGVGGLRSGAREAVRRTAMIGAAWLCTAYGYGPDQDPFVLAFKELAAHARSGRWAAADAALVQLAPALAEIHTQLARDPGPDLQRALAQRDPEALAPALVRLAQAAIALKFASSRREQLSDYYASKYRVEAARSYYAELLAPAVRRRDPALHERIWSRFDSARAALGRPGFLGRGSEPPDLAAFERAAREIDADLREAFPFLEEVTHAPE